jgi:probable rRNA maturation factor
MPFSLAVQLASRSKTLPSREQVRRWAFAAHSLAQAHMNASTLDGEVTIRYVDEGDARALNREFRGKDYATNVLTFPFVFPASLSRGLRKGLGSSRNKSVATRDALRYAADIAICAPVVAREARAQKKSAHDHHAHMVVHGALHAIGFDHENDDEAVTMEALEVRVLQRFRIKNPYE